jgi:virginiamycin A acetyltransferase
MKLFRSSEDSVLGDERQLQSMGVVSPSMCELYGMVRSETVRRRLRRWILALEGGPAESVTIRAILRRYYGVEIGLYSVAPCLSSPQVIHSGTRIGRHTILADTVRTFTRDHPMNTRSSHAVFYNPVLGRARGSGVVPGRLEIGNGVRIGHNTIILRPTSRIGEGVVVAPGAVVYTDVPPYALVEGNPAQVVGFRYSPSVIEQIIASRWWEKTPTELQDAVVGLPVAAEALTPWHAPGYSIGFTRSPLNSLGPTLSTRRPKALS